MSFRAIYSLAGAVLGAYLAIMNAHHLSDPSVGWIIRYGSIGGGLLGIVAGLNFAEEMRKRRSGS